jgi:hypothetical protein
MTNLKGITQSIIGLIVLVAGALQSDSFRQWLAPIIVAHPKLAVITAAATLILALLHNPAVVQLLKTAGVMVTATNVSTTAVNPAPATPQSGFTKLGVLFLMAALALGLVLLACTSTALHQSAEVANGNAITLGNIETMNEQANAAGLISAADSKLVSQYTLQVVQLNDQFIAQVRTGKTTTASSQSILTAIDGYAASLDTLAQQGVLHIKDANTQKTFASYIALLRASVATAKQLFAATAVTAPAAMLIPFPKLMPPQTLTFARAA